MYREIVFKTIFLFVKQIKIKSDKIQYIEYKKNISLRLKQKTYCLNDKI